MGILNARLVAFRIELFILLLIRRVLRSQAGAEEAYWAMVRIPRCTTIEMVYANKQLCGIVGRFMLADWNRPCELSRLCGV